MSATLYKESYTYLANKVLCQTIFKVKEDNGEYMFHVDTTAKTSDLALSKALDKMNRYMKKISHVREHDPNVSRLDLTLDQLAGTRYTHLPPDRDDYEDVSLRHTDLKLLKAELDLELDQIAAEIKAYRASKS